MNRFSNLPPHPSLPTYMKKNKESNRKHTAAAPPLQTALVAPPGRRTRFNKSSSLKEHATWAARSASHYPIEC